MGAEFVFVDAAAQLEKVLSVREGLTKVKQFVVLDAEAVRGRAGVLSYGAAVLLAANFFLLALSLMWLGAAAADVHDIAGPQLRGLGVAIYFFSVNLTAYVIGAPLIGRINDALGAGTNPQMMRYGLLLCPASSVLAALLLWRGSRKLENSGQ
ncbi:MAG: hypothetical protein ACJ74T_19865 [Pyrinomonadaceae bacterium]